MIANLFLSKKESQMYRIIYSNNNEKIDLIHPICIVGMPGIGDIGKFAVDQLIGILNAKKLYEILFYDYPAGAIIDDSVLSSPKAEILLYKDRTKKRDILLVTSDAQAMTPRGMYEFSDLISEILFEFRVEKIIALGGLPIRTKNDEMKIFITKTEEFDLSEFKYPNIEKINKGVIIGSNGLIPTIAKARFEIPGMVFLVSIVKNLNNSDSITDLKSSITLLEFISDYLDLPIEPNFSDDKISEISKDIEEKKKNLEKELNIYENISEEQNTEQNKSLYI
ncbi:MAG: PAC2 family protein [Promethearchaeota archaeon]